MPRILVVEDDTDLQFLYKTSLTRLGFEVVPAESTLAGINQLTHDLFDLVILDMNMPDLPGVKVIEFARDLKFPAPIVVISANEHWRRECMELGVETFLVKPVALAQLRAVVTQMTQRA